MVRTAQESAELAEPQAQRAFLAGRAQARIAAIFLFREDVRRQGVVQRIKHGGDAQLADIVDGGAEISPEVAQQLLPVELAGRDLVELGFERRGEIIFDIARKEILEEGGDDPALVLRIETVLLKPDIVARRQDLQRRGIGRRPANAEFFHALDQRGFGEARWRLGEVLVGMGLGDADIAAGDDLWQTGFGLVLLIIRAFLVEGQETVEQENRADGAQGGLLVGAVNVDCGALKAGAFHLAGHGAAPDQLVEARHITIKAQRFRQARETGRPDGFVRFLGVFRLGGIDARRRGHVKRAVFA